MPLKDAIETLENAIRFHRFSPAFPERLHVSNALLKEGWGSTRLRTLAAPIYITDLGIRHLTDPATFYEAHCEIASVLPISDESIINTLLTTPIEHLKDTLDATILFFGNYSAASIAISLRKYELVEAHIPDLLSTCGTILAAMNNTNAIHFFTKAADLASNFHDSYIYNHRLAATLIKRERRIKQALELLDRQLHICKRTDNSEKETALLTNLKALAILIQDKNIHHAMKLINMSLDAIEQAAHNSTYDSEALSRIYRYRSQIHINKAQLLLKLEKEKEATILLENNLHFVTQHSPEYVGEALASLALTYYFSRNYHTAIHASEHASKEFAKIGSISALNETRKILIASHMRLEETQQARATLHYLHEDPLGLAVSELSVR